MRNYQGVRTTRPNRIAAGMTKNLRDRYRSTRHVPVLSDELVALSVRGTLDRISPAFCIERPNEPCSCCGAKRPGKARLTDHGRARLYGKRKPLSRPDPTP